MAFFFLRKFREYKAEVVADFYSNISVLLENDKVKQLDNYIQHYCHTRLQHSLDVAYYSFFITRLFGWDSRSTARAALLHDLFLYDRYDGSYTGKNHVRTHPLIALENAREICTLNKIEEDIIKKHMWLITLMPPRYKEGFVVTFVDKFCAAKEFFTSMRGNHNAQSVLAAEHH